MQATDRLTKLTSMLERDPHDAFLLYAIAMEHKKLGRLSDALNYLAGTLDKDPDYAVAHQQAGMLHEQLGDMEAAREAYRRGIAVASRRAPAATVREHGLNEF